MEMRTTVSTFKPSPPPPPLCTLLRGCSARMRSMSTTMTAPSRIRRLRMPRSVSCEASQALEPKAASKVSPPLTLVVPAPPSTQQYQVPEGEGEGEGEGGGGGVTIIGARVRVKVPLKVYHVPRLAEVVELTGTEGRMKEYVGVSKGGINLSANLPFKVEFVYESKRGSGGLHKFTAHLKQDEFDYI